MLLPFTGYLVRPEWATRVVPPPAEALRPDERARITASNPDSFLHVTETDEAAETGATLAVARDALDRLLTIGAYQWVDEPALYVYRIRHGDWIQTGLVGTLPAAEFDGDRVRLHEGVSERRVEALARHLAEVGAVSSPIALGYRADPGLAELLRPTCAEPPTVAFATEDGAVHTVWRIGDERLGAELSRRLDGRTCYVTDGHHRAAAAKRAGSPGDFGGAGPASIAARVAPEERNRFGPAHRVVLVICFSHDQLRVLPFHRRVRGPVPDAADRMRGLGEVVSVQEHGPGFRSDGPAVAVYAGRRWWSVRHSGPPRPGVAGLLVDILHRDVLAPGFGIAALDDPRLELVSGLVPVESIEARCDADGGVAFLLPAPRIDEVFEIADRGEVMPPKSTFFHPKPRAGMFLLPR